MFICRAGLVVLGKIMDVRLFLQSAGQVKEHMTSVSAVSKNTPVILSTLGCKDNADAFLSGFKELKSRIDPPIIIVFGDMIEGMTGTFIHFRYCDAFASKNRQLRMDIVSQIITIREVA